MMIALSANTLIMLCITVMLEAGGEPPMGQRAVVYTVLNRAANTGTSIHEVLTKPKQYSCYNRVGLDALMVGDEYKKDAKKYLPLVSKAIRVWKDPVRRKWNYPGPTLFDATNYHTKDVSPWWSVDHKMSRVAIIGNHIFYKENE